MTEEKDDNKALMCLINKKENVRISVELRNPEGEVTDLSKITKQLAGMVKIQLNEEGNFDGPVYNQILPLVGESMMIALPELMGEVAAGIYIADQNTRYAIMYMGAIGFLLLKYIQQHKLKIFSIQEEITDEEINQLDQKQELTSMMIGAVSYGIAPKDLIKAIKKSGLDIFDNNILDEAEKDLTRHEQERSESTIIDTTPEFISKEKVDEDKEEEDEESEEEDND